MALPRIKPPADQPAASPAERDAWLVEAGERHDAIASPVHALQQRILADGRPAPDDKWPRAIRVLLPIALSGLLWSGIATLVL